MSRRHRLITDESGTSLVELLVGMTIMGVFMAMFTGAMLLMSRTVNSVEAATITSRQVTTAFLTLDGEVRYATGISNPTWDSSAAGWHVEFSSTQIDRSTSPATPTTTCTQLRTTSSQLLQRTWKIDSNNAAIVGSGTAWRPLASRLTPASIAQSATPFVLSTSGASGLQVLTTTLAATVSNPGTATSYSTSSFTALNSVSTGGPVDPTTVCQQVAPGAAAP